MQAKRTQLRNLVNGRELKQQMLLSKEPRSTVSFYKYHAIKNPTLFRDYLFVIFDSIDVLGRIYVAHEGINAQISVPADKFEEFKTALYSIDFLDGIRLNVAVEDDGKSFFKLAIKVRNKIVADGLNDEEFNPGNTGVHLKAEEFNQLTEQPDTIVVDMRNHYETEVGHFENAVLPDVDTFRDALPVLEDALSNHKDKHIVMYCTGGIRCEKASAYLKHKGFQHVYQLEGGIIKYARDVKAAGLKNKFLGKNFVFDERLGEKIGDTIISHCHQCGAECDTHTNCANEACHLLFIQCPECAKKYEACCSDECMEFNRLPEDKKRELRKSINKGNDLYKKGRLRPKLQDQIKTILAGKLSIKTH